MSTPRYEAVKAAREKLVAKMVFGTAKPGAENRLEQYDQSLKRLEGAKNRREETPSVGGNGVTINVGPEE